MKRFFYVVTVLYLLLTTYYKLTFADTLPQYITVTPSIINLDLATDPPEAEISYTNTTANTIELHLSVADFAPLEDGYKLQFLEGKDAKNYKYSLSSWVHFETNDITLNPKETKTVKIFIDKDRLTTGGHYGTIQAEWTREKDQSPVPTNLILSSLLFVRTNHGNETEEANINDFRQLQNFYLFPENFVLKIENTGNVEINPHGLVEIKDIFNHTVAKGFINENSLLALPESVRRYDIAIQNQQSYILPGIYHADMYIHFGEKNTIIRKSITFFSQGSSNLILYFIGLIILIFIGWKLVYFLSLRERTKVRG
ncbi:MAG TPA: hypothetical protein VLF89_01475 [Candidatus Saccharimonadales bacterium]|nr:hypothetical protein [Candidatus Saccharimonadales bacterium]